MSWLASRLTRGSGRAELVRFALVAFGAALAAVLLLGAGLVTAIDGGDCRRQGCTQGQLYRTDLLDQAGLRPGVVTGLVLMVVPVLVFLGMCARISAAQRDRRLAAIRLAGGTPGQVRLLAAAETAAPAALGAVVGLVGFVVAKALLERSYQQHADDLIRAALAAGVPSSAAYQSAMALVPARALPTDVATPIIRSLLVLLLVPALCAASAVMALRQVQTTPLGVARRARRQPRGTAFLILGAGLVLVVAAPFGGALLLPALALGATMVIVALMSSGSWLATRTGALVARRTGRPALLLAARRLQADPYGQGRALSGVVLAVLAASGASVLRAATLAEQSDDAFYRNSYDLVDLALAVALIVAAAGLLVASCEAVIERRRSLASLSAAGVPLATLRRAVLLQALLPAVPALLLAAITGTAAAQVFAGAVDGLTFPWLRLLAILALALAAVGLSTLLTVPLLRRSAQPSELRQT